MTAKTQVRILESQGRAERLFLYSKTADTDQPEPVSLPQLSAVGLTIPSTSDEKCIPESVVLSKLDSRTEDTDETEPSKDYIKNTQHYSAVVWTKPSTLDEKSIQESDLERLRDSSTQDSAEPEPVKDYTNNSQCCADVLTNPHASGGESIQESLEVSPLVSRTEDIVEPDPVKDIYNSHQCSDVGVTMSSTSDKTFIPESFVESPLFSRASGFEIQYDTHVLDKLRSNNIEYIENILEKKHIPCKQMLITAISECGYNKNIQYLLRSLSCMLKNEIPNCVGSWCGYRPTDPDCPVFVVTLENPDCDFDMDRICIDYEVIIRFKYIPDDEEKAIIEKTGETVTKGEDDTSVQICIAQNTESLMREHSNLSIIRGSYVRSRGYIKKKHEMMADTCIVFSVPVKGIIPIGEKEFTKSINGIPTDVREGEFILFAGNNKESYHHKLCMGCGISRPETGLSCTSGGFVDLPGNKTGCLTPAHVALTKDEMNQYIMGVEDRRLMNDSLKNGQINLIMYQPDAQADISLRRFGKVYAIALQQGFTTVDAALIEITKDDRIPDTGSFPEGDYSDVGFPIHAPMTFNSGNILDLIPSSQKHSDVIKFGKTTDITRGRLGWDGTSARLVSVTGCYSFPTMIGQVEINSPGFADHGDSGALAFICYDGDQHNLHAIGMVIGGSTTGCSTLITPIRAIFQELELKDDRFKVFPPNVASNKGHTSQDIEYIVKRHEHALGEHSESLNIISERITTMENAMTRGFNEINTKFDNIAAILENMVR